MSRRGIDDAAGYLRDKAEYVHYDTALARGRPVPKPSSPCASTETSNGEACASLRASCPDPARRRGATESYRAAVRRGFGSPLTTGAPLETPWDPALRQAIEQHAVRVEEEHLIPELLGDLSRPRR